MLIPTVLLALQAVGPSSVAPLPARPVEREIENPDWRRATPTDPMRYYPLAAQRAGVEGSATIACLVTAKGALEKCLVIAETPPGFGFGEAAITMSSLFTMRPETKNGVPVEGGTVKIPIRFQFPR